MYNLLRKQVILLFSFCCVAVAAMAQREQYRLEHDDLKIYFGATLGTNFAHLAAHKSERFLSSDSILVAEPAAVGGITIGMQATAKLTKRLYARFNPQIIIGGARYFNYTLNPKYATNEPVEQRYALPTTLISFPLSFKFNSDRIDNFRTYLLFGVKADIDVQANSSARNQEGYIKLKKYDFGIEAGIGFKFFFPYVSVVPELKFSYGLSNILDRNSNLKYSAVFDKIQSRMVMFSIHFEH